MYIGNHFRKRAQSARRRLTKKTKQKKNRKTDKLLAGDGRTVPLAKSFRESFLELSFLQRKFRCKVFDAGTFVYSFRWILASAFHALAARRLRLFHLTRIESHSILSSAWPERDRTTLTAFRCRSFEIIQGRCDYLAESAKPDSFTDREVFLFLFFYFFFFTGEGNLRGSKRETERATWKIYIFTERKESWSSRSFDDIARSPQRSQLYYENVIDEIN